MEVVEPQLVCGHAVFEHSVMQFTVKKSYHWNWSGFELAWNGKVTVFETSSKDFVTIGLPRIRLGGMIFGELHVDWNGRSEISRSSLGLKGSVWMSGKNVSGKVLQNSKEYADLKGNLDDQVLFVNKGLNEATVLWSSRTSNKYISRVVETGRQTDSMHVWSNIVQLISQGDHFAVLENMKTFGIKPHNPVYFTKENNEWRIKEEWHKVDSGFDAREDMASMDKWDISIQEDSDTSQLKHQIT